MRPPRRAWLANGAAVVTRERPASQVVAVDLAIRAGSRYEGPATDSAAQLLEHALLLGTAHWPTRDELLRAIGGRGGELGISAGRELLEVTLAIGLPDLDLGLRVLRDVLAAACFDEAAIGREREVILQQLQEREDDPETHARDRLFDVVFAGHPLGRRPSGTPEGVRSLSVERLRSFWAEHRVAPRIVAGVVSGLGHDEAVERLDGLLGDFPGGETASPLASWPAGVPASLDLPIGTDQAHAFVAATVPGVRDEDRSALRALNAILGRVSGRLFVEIRDRRGLAYTAYSTLAQYSDGGIFLTYAGTDPEDLDAVVGLLRTEIRRLADDGVSETELQRAVRGEIGAWVVGLETSGAEAVAMTRDAVHGLPPRDEQAAQLRMVTPDDIQRIARTYLADERLSVVVTRPPADLEPGNVETGNAGTGNVETGNVEQGE
ncbi:MAG: insulinase family protein [Chloroflexi bacterium]|nr:insulinase family protein [Chloroflexota bacterium]